MAAAIAPTKTLAERDKGKLAIEASSVNGPDHRIVVSARYSNPDWIKWGAWVEPLAGGAASTPPFHQSFVMAVVKW